MAPPKVTKAGAGYILTWSDEPIVIALDRIRESSDFVVSAELTIKTTAPGVPSHLHQARFNLTSTQARSSLAKHLTEQYGEIAHWPTVLEQMAALVLAALREGEPAESVADIPEPEGIQYRIRPILLERQPTLLYGEGGAAKSLLAQYLSLMVALPVLDGGYDVEPGAVLYLDYETDRGDFRRRLGALSAGMGYTLPQGIHYRRCYQPLATEVSEIQKIVAERDVQFVVIDSAGLACGGKPQDESMVIPFFGALRQIGVTTFTIAHVAKNAHEKTPFGSVYWINMPRSVYEVKKAQNEEQSETVIGLWHRKVNIGRPQKPFGFRFSFSESPESIKVERARVSDSPELSSQLSLMTRILDSLSRGPKTVEQLAEETGGSADQVRARLAEQKGRRVTLAHSEGQMNYWALKARGPES